MDLMNQIFLTFLGAKQEGVLSRNDLIYLGPKFKFSNLCSFKSGSSANCAHALLSCNDPLSSNFNKEASRLYAELLLCV